MRALWGIPVMCLTLLMVVIQSGCASDRLEEKSYPINPDPAKLEPVELGKTDRAEILEWFGPPRLTYDGDELKLSKAGSEDLKKKVPGGMVALGYFNYQMEFIPSTRVSGDGVEHSYEEKVVSKERILFMISKKDGIVRKVDRAIISADRPEF